MADRQWADMARELAAVVRRQEQIAQERGALAVTRERLERELALMLEREQEQPAPALEAEQDGRAPFVRVPEWMPAWAKERQAQTVDPGHGNSTTVLQSSAPMSELSKPMLCPDGALCELTRSRVEHSHTADGVVTRYERP